MAFTIHYTKNSPIHLLNTVPTGAAIILYLVAVPFIRQTYEVVVGMVKSEEE
jgi:hypothetical protein